MTFDVKNLMTVHYNNDCRSSLEAEKSLVGSIIIDGEKILQVYEIVSADDFYFSQLGEIYKAAVNLYLQKSGVGFDVIQLLERLSATFTDISKKDMKKIMSELMSYVPTSSHAVEYAHLVKKYSALRTERKICSSLTIVLQEKLN